MNCFFFEVSAKTEDNIKKMLYTSIVELPMFDKYRTLKVQDLIEELENCNNNNSLNDSKLNNSGILESSRNNNNELNINSDRDIKTLKKHEICKC
jgi:hypothetical protein